MIDTITESLKNEELLVVADWFHDRGDYEMERISRKIFKDGYRTGSLVSQKMIDDFPEEFQEAKECFMVARDVWYTTNVSGLSFSRVLKSIGGLQRALSNAGSTWAEAADAMSAMGPAFGRIKKASDNESFPKWDPAKQKPSKRIK